MPTSAVLRSMVQPTRLHADWAVSDQVPWILFVAFYAGFANLPYWIASRFLGLMPLGWFCIEYACIGLLALFLPRMVTAPLLLMAIAADLISGVSKTYYLAPTECLQNFASLHELPISRLLSVIAVGLLIFSLAGAVALFPAAKMRGVFRLRAALCLIAFVCAALTMDYVSACRDLGHFGNPLRSLRPGDTDRFSNAANLWMGRYPVLRIRRDEALFGSRLSRDDSHISDSSSTPSASAIAIPPVMDRVAHGADSRPNVVVVLLESWGIDLDTAVRGSLVDAYSDQKLLDRYKVSQGEVPFYGSTVAGEARELCGSKIGMRILNVSSSDGTTCLPRRLAAAGYHSIAVHGMDGHMFRRSDWYNTIGFQERWFRDSFRQQGLPDCIGAFTGTCDAAIADWIGNRLEVKEAQPSFVYWVTLNSHLPVPVPSPLTDAASCSFAPELATNPTLCSWYQLIANVHQSVARLALSSLARPTIFVIVGDHAPPFANPELRSQFSGSEVPYIILEPRGGGDLSASASRLQLAVAARPPR
jgi:hypothetical protein